MGGLHNEGVTSDKLEPVHARDIAGFNQTHEQHASWPARPVSVSLHISFIPTLKHVSFCGNQVQF